MSNSIKREFERHMVKCGNPNSFDNCSDTGRLDQELRVALSTTVACPASSQGRRLNNFCIGSDPEFVFVAPNHKAKTHASEFGLKPGLSVGCDQNQRLAELRGFPTTSVVTHVAGLLSSLRWMYRTYPITKEYYWRAGSWHSDDGIGGHVHFGRKRPDRLAEVEALDGMASLFQTAGFFDMEGWNRRQHGDPHRQRYGLFGDIRPQVHGYEYRTLPSWLCSPSKAFVVLTASKLAILDPELTAAWRRDHHNPETGLDLLQRLARYYAGRDDDAWIMKHLLTQKTFLKEKAIWAAPMKDFKPYWGFDGDLPRPTSTTGILPAVIEPAPSEVLEVSAFLSQGTPLRYSEVSPTFRSALPKGNGYFWMYKKQPPGGNRAGVGDLMHNLVGCEGFTCSLSFTQFNDENPCIKVSNDLVRSFTVEEWKKVRTAFSFQVQGLTSGIATILIDWRLLGMKQIAEVRTFLLDMGLFPLWTVESVVPDSLVTFKKQREAAKAGLPKHQPKPRERKL